jgi:hypothetical protein
MKTKLDTLKLFLLFSFILVVVIPSARAALTDGIVSHWTMNESAGSAVFVDSLQYQNLSIYLGGAGTSGIIGNAMNASSVSSAAMVLAVNTKTAFKTENVSIIVWIYGSPGNDRGVVDATNSGCGAGSFQFDTGGTGDLRFITNALKFSASASFINASAWNMVVYRVTPTNGSIWVNGILRGSTATPSWAIPTGASCYPRFGAYTTTTGQMAGKMDEVSWYNRGLSDAEILAIYRNVSAGKPYPYIETPSGAVTNDSVFVAPSPANNSVNITQVTFNATCDTGNTTLLYFDSSATPTTLVKNTVNYADYTTSVPTYGTFYISAICNNSGTLSNRKTLTWNFTQYPTQNPVFVSPSPANNSASSGQVTVNASCATGNTSMIYFGNDSSVPTTLVSSGITMANYTTSVSIFTAYRFRAVCNNTGLLSFNNTLNWSFIEIPAVSNPVFIAPSPANNSVNNTQVTFNASCSSGNFTILYFDSNTVPTTLVKNTINYADYTTSAVIDQPYYIRAVCNSSGIYSGNLTRKWTLDNTNPGIAINPGNEFSDDNYTSRDQYDDFFIFNMTFSDNNQLFAYQINITRNSGIPVYQETNTTLSGVSFNYNRTIDISSWNSTTYAIEVLVSDSHTAKEIKEYAVITNSRMAQFDTAEGNRIILENTEDAEITTTKKTDRYELEYKFSDKKRKDRSILVRSDKPIVYIKDSLYKAHFVVFNGQTGNWLDFEGIPGDYEVIKLNDYVYQVNFKNMPSDVKLKSIGGLNVLRKTYTWFRGKYSYNQPSGIFGGNENFFLNVTKDASISDISAVLIYNASLKNLTKINQVGNYYFNSSINQPLTGSLIRYTWNVTVTQANGTTQNIFISTNHTIADFGIGECDVTYKNHTLDIRYYDEQYPTDDKSSHIIPARNDLTIFYWTGAKNNVRNTTFKLEFDVSPPWLHRLCLINDKNNISADVYMTYTTTTDFSQVEFIRKHYLINHTFIPLTAGIAEDLNLYAPNGTSRETGYLNLSILKLTTRKLSNYDYLPGIFTSLQRYYTDTGVWKTVQMDESGDFGGLLFYIYEKYTDYRLSFMNNNGTTLKQTNSFKLVCNLGVCDIVYLLNPDPISASLIKPGVNVKYYNDTKILTVNWTVYTGLSQNVEVKVTQSRINTILTLCAVNQTGTGGNFACDLSGRNGDVFVNVRQNGKLVFSEWISLATQKIGEILNKNEQAFWAAGFVITCVMFGLFSPVAVIITSFFGLVVGFMFGFSPFSFVAIIISAVVGIVIAIKVRN